MGASVWCYSRAECDEPGCDGKGPLHFSALTAAKDAVRHDGDHANAAAVEAEILRPPFGGMA